MIRSVPACAVAPAHGRFGTACRSGAATAGMLLGLASPAQAQLFGNPLLQSEIPSDYDRGRNTSVLDRPRPEYEARGNPVGPLTVRTRLRSEIGATSNVNGNDAFRRPDAYALVAPEVSAETDALLDRMALAAGAEVQRFARTPERNQMGYFASASARHAVARDTELNASAVARRYYEQNISTGIPADTAQPVPVDFLQANLRGEQTVRRWKFTVVGDARRLTFGDIRTLGGGIAEQDYRNRNEWLFAGRASYAATPETSAFVEIAGTQIGYSNRLFDGRDNRDARQLRLLGGFNVDIGAIVRGRLGVGYAIRDYASPLYRSLRGAVADGRLQFFPSTLTTVTISGRRYAGESAILVSPGYFGTGIRVEADHELDRNLLLNASADFEDDRYRQSTHRDRAEVVSSGARYFVSRTVSLGVQGSYLRRRSGGDFALPDFSERRILFSMVLQR